MTIDDSLDVIGTDVFGVKMYEFDVWSALFQFCASGIDLDMVSCAVTECVDLTVWWIEAGMVWTEAES